MRAIFQTAREAMITAKMRMNAAVSACYGAYALRLSAYAFRLSGAVASAPHSDYQQGSYYKNTP